MRRRHLLRDQHGALIVEFAVVLPLLLVLIMGILDFGRALNYWIDETHLANEAARFAAVGHNPGADSGQTLQQWTRLQGVTSELRGKLGLRVCLSFPKGRQVGNPVDLKVTATFKWLPFLTERVGLTATVLRGGSTMRLEAREDILDKAGITAGCAG